MSLTPQNRQEEWYQQMINASTGNYLPSIDSGDAGKVLTVANDGSWEVANVPTELPSVSGTDENKVLTVDSSGYWVAQAIPSQLPTVTSDDKDKYLHTNASTGSLEWSAVSGGGVMTVTITYDDVESKYTLDKTWQEIHDAGFCIAKLVSPETTNYLTLAYIENSDAYYVGFSGDYYFSTDTANGYPSFVVGGGDNGGVGGNENPISDIS